MSDMLFDLYYYNMLIANDVWNALEAKYLMKDVTTRKFLATKFFNYKIIDARPVAEQFNDIMHILNQFNQHNINMDKEIIVSYIIDKLLSS